MSQRKRRLCSADEQVGILPPTVRFERQGSARRRELIGVSSKAVVRASRHDLWRCGGKCFEGLERER